MRPALSLRRRLVVWLGSYVVVSIGLFCYVGIPLGPLLIAGVLTGLLTIFKHRAAARQRETPIAH